MLELINNRLDEPELRELLSYAVFPDEDVLDAVIEQYRTEPELRLYGYLEDGAWIGVIGCAQDQEMPDALRVRHMAIAPDERGLGYGRGIILKLLAMEKPAMLMADADAEGAEFYRNIGFSVIGTGENAFGAADASEQFVCIFHAEEEEPEE
ncbi:GNAT family N-acetyltransferase [Paenibacillus sp. Z6-24]